MREIYVPSLWYHVVCAPSRQLLHDCGIGVEGEEGEGEMASSAVGQHRILIFCQFKGILDIIENDLFK